MLTLLLRAIRHGNGLDAFDEDKGRVADDGHTGGGSQSFLQYSYVRAVALDRQFGDAPLALSLDERLWTLTETS